MGARCLSDPSRGRSNLSGFKNATVQELNRVKKIIGYETSSMEPNDFFSLSQSSDCHDVSGNMGIIDGLFFRT